MTATVLVTGSTGELGHSLISFLRTQPQYKTVAVDLQPKASDQNFADITFVQADILDKQKLSALFDQYRFDLIFHFAALLSTSGEKDPVMAHQVNVNGTFNLLELAKKHSEQRQTRIKFLFPSTIAAYGLDSPEIKAKAGRVTEDQYLKPITMYGINKLYVEHLGRYFSTSYGLLSDSAKYKIDFRGVRFPGLLSADTVPTGGTSDYGPEMLHAAAKDVAYDCFVTQNTYLPFMTMPDAVKALVTLAEAKSESLSRHIYNVGSFSLSAQAIYDEVKKYFPKAIVNWKVDQRRHKIVESWPADLDDSAARRDWGWSPEYDKIRAFKEYLVPGVVKRYGLTADKKMCAGD